MSEQAGPPPSGPQDRLPDPSSDAAQASSDVPRDPPPGPSLGTKRPRGRQTALDMVRSMIVILAFVGGVLLLAPQPDGVEQPQVSGIQAGAALQEATTLLGTTPLLLAPSGALDGADLPQDSVVELGEDWRLDYARTEQADAVDTWRVGVLSPDERRVDLEQALDPTEQWLTRPEDGRPGLPEPVEVGGLTWTVQQRGDGDTSWTWTDPSAGGLTTALSAPSESDDLRAVVEAVSVALSR